MSDSNITVAHSEVRAEQDLNQTVINRLQKLLEQDPAFSLPVQARLHEASRALDQAGWLIRQARIHLGQADAMENWMDIA